MCIHMTMSTVVKAILMHTIMPMIIIMPLTITHMKKKLLLNKIFLERIIYWLKETEGILKQKISLL